jgi:hypothetical protein
LKVKNGMLAARLCMWAEAVSLALLRPPGRRAKNHAGYRATDDGLVAFFYEEPPDELRALVDEISQVTPTRQRERRHHPHIVSVPGAEFIREERRRFLWRDCRMRGHALRCHRYPTLQVAVATSP